MCITIHIREASNHSAVASCFIVGRTCSGSDWALIQGQEWIAVGANKRLNYSLWVKAGIVRAELKSHPGQILKRRREENTRSKARWILSIWKTKTKLLPMAIVETELTFQEALERISSGCWVYLISFDADNTKYFSRYSLHNFMK